MAGNRISVVQGYRFLLFLAVFLFHCSSNLFSIGWGGVQAFLVLSSFFLTKKLYTCRKILFGKELTRRLKRLYPAYILVILGAALFYLLWKSKIPYDVPVFLLSAQNFFWVIFGWDTPLCSILGHTWYITLDVYLFIIWVFTLKIIPKSKWLLISYIGVLFSILWRVVCNLVFDDRTVSYTIPFGQMDSYCIGSILAMNMIKGKTNARYSAYDIAVGILGILVMFWFAGYSNDLNIIESYQFFGDSSNYTGHPFLVNIYLFVGLLSAGILRACLNSRNHRVLSSKWLVTLGNWSYELYLFHYPIVWILRRIADNNFILIAAALPLTILTAYIWHRFAETRIVNLIGK